MRARHPALVALAVAAAATTAHADEPRQPATSAAIERYYESGEWALDTADVIDEARAALDERRDAVAKPAIVLDIDDTALSNYDCLRAARFDRERAGEACVRSGELPAIADTLALFRHARASRVAVFFITGRRSKQRSVTTANLRRAGYTGTWTLLLRPNRQPRAQRAGWKARTRRSIERRGYTIVVNVGDQRSDLSGGAALRAFKLPNPMYTIPIA